MIDEKNNYRSGASPYKEKQFRHRFRMSPKALNELLVLFESKNWFSRPVFDNEHQQDGRKRRLAPLILLVMGSLAILGCTTSFELLPGFTHISSQTHRVFFDEFCEICGGERADHA